MPFWAHAANASICYKMVLSFLKENSSDSARSYYDILDPDFPRGEVYPLKALPWLFDKTGKSFGTGVTRLDNENTECPQQ